MVREEKKCFTINRRRKIFCIFLVDRLAIKHCRSNNVELLYAVIGVLINLTVDEDKRECLKIYEGIERLFKNLIFR
jgi:hypothetical protein